MLDNMYIVFVAGSTAQVTACQACRHLIYLFRWPCPYGVDLICLCGLNLLGYWLDLGGMEARGEILQ